MDRGGSLSSYASIARAVTKTVSAGVLRKCPPMRYDRSCRGNKCACWRTYNYSDICNGGRVEQNYHDSNRCSIVGKRRRRATRSIPSSSLNKCISAVVKKSDNTTGRSLERSVFRLPNTLPFVPHSQQLAGLLAPLVSSQEILPKLSRFPL